jgi:hypothetical protein
MFLIPSYLGFRVLRHLLDGMDYQFVSSASAPDGRLVVTELQSSSEGAHAPYGQHLVLSREVVSTPDEGYVLFAGYCKSVSYSWASNEEIIISCDGGNAETIRTKSIRALGIEIKYQ